MKTFKTILTLNLLILFTLLIKVPCHALEQGDPVEALALEDIVFFDYELNKKSGPPKFELKLPVAIETQGLRGPLPQDNPVARYFWDEYKDRGMKRAVEYNPNDAKLYKTPFIRLTAIQRLGTPVKIKLLAPKPQEITMPLSGMEGPGSQVRYQVIKRFFHVRILSNEGDLIVDEDKEKISLIENKDTMEISWIPSIVEDKYGLELTAPVVLELSLSYRVKRDMIINGKVNDGWNREGWIERRVAWLALPVCGQEFGEDDEPISCPASIAVPPPWKTHDLGVVSLQVPTTWDSQTRNGNGRFEVGDNLAGITVVREEGGEKQLKYMTEIEKKTIEISGLSAVQYTGKVKEGKVAAKLILFEDKPSDGKVLGIATVLKDDKYADILEASLSSIKIDQGKSDVPAISAGPAAHIPEVGDLGSGQLDYAPANIPQKEYEPAEQKTQAVKTEPAEGVVPPVPAPETQPTQTPDTGKTSLKLKKGFGDFVGRNEAFRGNGSPDSRLRLEIQAPDQTITGLELREADTKALIWDTQSGNFAWLMGVTKKNKPITQTDGSIHYPLGKDREKLDLWVQDNHTIARGKKQLELLIRFDHNKSLIVPVER
ncbi:MAG: hypothetical protein HUN05_11480 [Desulfobacter sp.]|nr:MAG: hypothetical protein HUN05_11480 [Desulfobacter sp.]